MEPPYKRQRLDHSTIHTDRNQIYDVSDHEDDLDTRYDRVGDDAEVEDEGSLDPDFELEQKRAQLDYKLKSRFEAIFEKYGRDFSGVGDEVDLVTGKIIVDNGHLAEMQNEGDTGTTQRNGGGAFGQEHEATDEEDDEDDDEEDEEILGSTEEDSDDFDDEQNSESMEDDRAILYHSDSSGAVGLGTGLRDHSVPMEESESDITSRGAFLPHPATLPSEDEIIAQFGPQLAPQIIKYVSQQRALGNSKVEPAWRTPAIPISAPGKRQRPLLKTVLLRPDSDRSVSPEDGTSIWGATDFSQSGHLLKQRKQRIDFTDADDKLVVEWVKLTQMEGYQLWGKHWRELERIAPHHSFRTYKDYYRRKLFPRGLEHGPIDSMSSAGLDLQSLSKKLSHHLLVETLAPDFHAQSTLSNSREFESSSETFIRRASSPPYTEEDDALLLDWCMKEYSGDRVGVWMALEKEAPRHSATSWAARYRRFRLLGITDPSKQASHLKAPYVQTRSRLWTKEEDAVVDSWIAEAKQMGLVIKHRSIWAGVSDRLPGRTFEQCKHRVHNRRLLRIATEDARPTVTKTAAYQLTPSTSPHARTTRPTSRSSFAETPTSFQTSHSRSQRARQAAKQTPGTVSWSEAIRDIERADPHLHASILKDMEAADFSDQPSRLQRDVPRLSVSPRENRHPVLYNASTHHRSGQSEHPQNNLTLPSSIPNSDSNADFSSPEQTPSPEVCPNEKFGLQSVIRTLQQDFENDESWPVPDFSDSESIQDIESTMPVSPPPNATLISPTTARMDNIRIAAREDKPVLITRGTTTVSGLVCADCGTRDVLQWHSGLETLCTTCGQLRAESEKDKINSGQPPLLNSMGNQPRFEPIARISPSQTMGLRMPGSIEPSNIRPRSDQQNHYPVLTQSPPSVTQHIEPRNTTDCEPGPAVLTWNTASPSSSPSRVRSYNIPPRPVIFSSVPTAKPTSLDRSALEYAKCLPRSSATAPTIHLSPHPQKDHKHPATPAPVTPKPRRPPQSDPADDEEDELSLMVDDSIVMSATPSKQVFKAEKAKGHLKRLFDEARSSPERTSTPKSAALRKSNLKFGSSATELFQTDLMPTSHVQQKSNTQFSSSATGSSQRETTPTNNAGRKSFMQVGSPAVQQSQNVSSPKDVNRRQNSYEQFSRPPTELSRKESTPGIYIPRRSDLKFCSSAAELSQRELSPVVISPGGTKRKCGDGGFRCERDFCFTCD